MQFINLPSIDNSLRINYKDVKLLLLRDFFDNNIFKQIKNEIKLKILDEDVNFEKVNGQKILNRKIAKTEHFPIFKNIDEFIKTDKELLNKINTILNSDFKSIGASLWWDKEGYNLPYHIDNELIKGSIQIYLGDENEIDETLGTSFSYGDKYFKGENQSIFTLPYYPNSGYLYVNTDVFAHGLSKKVPKGFNRFSIYFILI